MLSKLHAWVMNMLSPHEHSDHLYNAVNEYFEALDDLSCDTGIAVADNDAWLRFDAASEYLRGLRNWYKEQQ